MQRLKRLPAMWETWARSLSQENPLEKEMATHSSILAWRIPWMEELGGLQSTGRKELDTTSLSLSLLTSSPLLQVLSPGSLSVQRKWISSVGPFLLSAFKVHSDCASPPSSLFPYMRMCALFF